MFKVVIQFKTAEVVMSLTGVPQETVDNLRSSMESGEVIHLHFPNGKTSSVRMSEALTMTVTKEK